MLAEVAGWDREAYPYLVNAAWGSTPLIVVQTRDQKAMRLIDAATGEVLREDTDPYWTDVIDGVPARLGNGDIVWTGVSGDTRGLVVAPAAELAAALEYRSGLYGLAGTADMRQILSRAEGGDERAELARDTYLHRLRASVASMAAAMDGLDAIAFTGGVGENSAEIRRRAMDGLGFLGIAADLPANAAGTGDRQIGAPAAAVRALVISAREDIEIARQVRAALTAGGAMVADGRD